MVQILTNQIENKEKLLKTLYMIYIKLAMKHLTKLTNNMYTNRNNH